MHRPLAERFNASLAATSHHRRHAPSWRERLRRFGNLFRYRAPGPGPPGDAEVAAVQGLARGTGATFRCPGGARSASLLRRLFKPMRESHGMFFPFRPGG